MVMKKMLLTVSLLLAGIVVQAQDCEALVLPCFNNDRNALANYPAEKLLYRCLLAQSAFYESDSIPTGAHLFDISEVQVIHDGSHLSASFVVDLNTLSYYGYNFKWFQFQAGDCDQVVCFRTPSSTHPYLVLRPVNEMYTITDRRYFELQNQ